MESNPTVVMVDQLLRVITLTALTDAVHLGFFLLGIAILYFCDRR